MSFLYPLGFLALLAIPVLIFIYIIKNRYTEQTITSTYLWTLSERFLRKRIPINRLSGIISLLLQILAVILISLILAHPIISVQGGADDYCFILDGSGSMRIEQGGSTRFDEGKEYVAKIIEESMNGSTYTFINVGDSVYRSATFTDKELALKELDGLNASYAESVPDDALAIANEYMVDYPAATAYLVTDRTYKNEPENVIYKNVVAGTENYAISDVEYKASGSDLTVTGKVTSYGSDVESLKLTISFLVTDEDGAGNFLKTDEITVEQVSGGEENPTEFQFTCSGKTDFSAFKVAIVESDAMAADNEVVIYNVNDANIGRTLVVYGKTKSTDEGKDDEYAKDGPRFLLNALKAAGNNKVEEFISDLTYEGDDSYHSGYGLYIFNSCVPSEMPRDGAVWFINPTKSVEGANFSYQTELTASGNAKYSTSTNTAVKSMLEGTVLPEFVLDKYAKLNVSGSFRQYISCDGNPLLASGTNAYGNREVVFAFDLNSSADFTLSSDCVTIVNHLLNYSFPAVIEQTFFYCGETLQVNIVSGFTGVRIQTPLGEYVYPDVSTSISEYQLTEAGVYDIYLVNSDGQEEDPLHVFAAMPIAERALAAEDTGFVMTEPEGEKPAGIIDNLLIIFIILAVISVADYGVYCYEQYQLR